MNAGLGILGIELGSTRIKAVLLGPDHSVIAAGSHAWQNQYVDGVWTYPLADVRDGLRGCYASLARDLRERHEVELSSVAALGVSAMMHGYVALDAHEKLLTPFRTWRNTNTGAASERLTAELGVNIAHRWTAAHLYQAMLDHEPHLSELSRVTTLASYVHSQLTGRHVTGVGDASGIFPVQADTFSYDPAKLETFDRLASAAGHPVTLRDLLPEVLVAGEHAGNLTEEGARLLDPSGTLRPGARCCPPEGDAGTGMVATNAITPRMGNISAGTSIFAMVVLEKPLSQVHRELDVVATPSGVPVAMVHCNNGADELQAWVSVFAEFAERLGAPQDRTAIFDIVLRAALDGAPDGGGLMAFGCLSGEPVLKLDEGRPLLTRSPESRFDLANLVRTQLYALFAPLSLGMQTLRAEGAHLDHMHAHGGLFTTKEVAQRFLAAVLDAPVSVGERAPEGGAWGMAVLASYSIHANGRSLDVFLEEDVFQSAAPVIMMEPGAVDVEGFKAYQKRYVAALPLERSAASYL